MAEKKGFDLAGLMKSVSNLNTREQIEYLPIEQLDVDPNNFYSIEGIEELADSIATVGLVHPLRVRQAGERYVITSGHRRRAAIALLIEGGADWSQGVPCVVDRGEHEPEFEELKLIFANRQRQKTSAELSLEAARTDELFCLLREKGYEFPGRMQEHVAAALGVKASKLKRLHAIRANLVPELLRYYDDSQLVEDVAYQLSRFPAEIQTALAGALEARKNAKMPVGSVVQEVWNRLEDLQKPMACRAHAGNPDCHNVTGRIVRSLTVPYSWDVCPRGTCCMDCYKARQGCKGACREAQDRAKLDKDVANEEQAKKEEQRQREQKALQRRISRRAQELLPLCEAAGLADNQRIYDNYCGATVGNLRKWAAGDMEGKYFYSEEALTPTRTVDVKTMASRLGCSLELAMGLPQKTAAAPEADDLGEDEEPHWLTGDPPVEGWYVTWAKVETWDPDYEMCWWDGKVWKAFPTSGAPAGAEILGWWPAPQPMEG